MAKNSVSEWSTVSSGNGDIAGLTLGLDMPPSYVNNSIQEMMAQIKQWKDGYTDPITGLPVYQSLTVENIDIEGGLALNGSYGDAGQVVVSQGASATPIWGSGFPVGGIIMWSGSTATIPSGWRLCDGGNGTPDLRDRFVVGAGLTYAVNEKGGNANAVVVSHNHGGSVSVATKSLSGTIKTRNGGGGRYADSVPVSTTGVFTWKNLTGSVGNGWQGEGGGNSATITMNANHNHSATLSVSNTGVSGSNANLPPYYALCYIMKV